MRYLPNTTEDREMMLREIGVNSFEDLLEAIPKSLRLQRPLSLELGKSEYEVTSRLKTLARKNLHAADFVSFLGAGSYDHFIPSAISALVSRSEFLTAYTPYQPEVAQGTLQVIYEYQSMICELFAMDAANASVYDGGTALAEAAILARAHTQRPDVLWPQSVHPHYRKVAQTICVPSGISFHALRTQANGSLSLDDLKSSLNDQTAAVVFQYPNFFGLVEDLRPYIAAVQAAGALAILVVDPMAMGVLEAPGNLGADVVIGEGQCLGNPQSYGGPYLGLFTVKDKYVRRMPGRIVGITRDADGRRGYVLTLQTREQHIRRDKATSNICTNEGLCAARAAIYLSLLGPQGLKQIGENCMKGSAFLIQELQKISGISVVNGGTHFKEFVIRLSRGTNEFLEFMAKKGILAGIPLKRFHMGLDDCLLVAVTECRTKEEMERYVECVREFFEEKR